MQSYVCVCVCVCVCVVGCGRCGGGEVSCVLTFVKGLCGKHRGVLVNQFPCHCPLGWTLHCLRGFLRWMEQIGG